MAGGCHRVTDGAADQARRHFTPTIVATATANTAFRGVVLSPVATPDPVIPEVPVAALLPLGALGTLVAGLYLTRTRRTSAFG